VYRIDRIGYGNEPVQGDDEAVLEPAGVREADPSLRIDADVVLARPTSGANPARPDVVDNDLRPRLERTRGIGIEDLPTYLVARKVRQLEFFAEGHLSTRCLDVAEAHAARQHPDERVAGGKFGFWDLDLF
jgi:hypothetical protein